MPTPAPAPTPPTAMPSVEEAFQHLIAEVGWAKAHVLVKAEAAALRISADSPRAMKNAIATHKATKADKPNESVQEGLLP